MALTRLSGNQIEDTTNAILASLTFASQDSILKIPVGDDTAQQRPTNPALGMLRFNTVEDRVEQYVSRAKNSQPGWINVRGGGGGAGLGEYQLIRGNARSIEAVIEIPSNVDSAYGFENSFTVGPNITIASGNTVTVNEGVTWTIVETGLEPNTLDTAGLGSIIGPQWTNIGSNDGLGEYQLIRGNPRTIEENITVPYNPATNMFAYESAYIIGPEITIASTFAVTVEDGVVLQIL